MTIYNKFEQYFYVSVVKHFAFNSRPTYNSETAKSAVIADKLFGRVLSSRTMSEDANKETPESFSEERK